VSLLNTCAIIIFLRLRALRCDLQKPRWEAIYATRGSRSFPYS
jgi:hypothetical protein